MVDLIGIYDHEVGENKIVEMTAAEQSERDREVAEYLAKEAAKEAATKEAEAAKEVAQAKLAALGLTVDDLKALGL
jgi:hypothetical protein